ncbi:MAG: hypothetical protein J0L94_09160 [Rhodothermia bacterium]|nr:hypothetical protein [Rhodothermia bacterium]
MKNITYYKSLLLLTLIGLLLARIDLTAQVSGLSYTLSPSVEYVRWDPGLGLRNAPLVGGQVGFGFGEFVELRAQYLWNNKIETDWAKVTGLTAFQKNELGTQTLAYKKMGGDLRFNLMRGNVLPFLTLGAGVQTFKPSDENDRSSIFLNVGGGLTLRSIDRLTFSIYARNTAFRLNPLATFVDAQTLDELEINTGTTERRNFQHWGAGASFALYLGGRKSGQLTKVDREMMQQFSGGFSGLSVPAHAFLGKLDFSEDLPFRSTRVAGANAGLNFGPLFGLRGFYWQGIQDETWKKDDLRMYGGELNFRLNEGMGITPYLALGGGMLDVGDTYVGKNGFRPDDTPFVMGGGGITVPVGRFIALNGGVRAILASNQDLDDLGQPDQLKTNWMYHAGINLNIGRKPSRPNVIRKDQSESERLATEKAWEEEMSVMRASYEARMQALESAIGRAEARGDSLASVQLQKTLQETRALHDAVPVTPITPPTLPSAGPKAVDRAADATTPKPSSTPTVQKVEVQPNQETRVITLPVLEDGEIYIRFGKTPSTFRPVGETPSQLTPPDLLRKLKLLERKVDSLQTELVKRDTLQRKVIISQSPTILRYNEMPKEVVSTNLPTSVISPKQEVKQDTQQKSDVLDVKTVADSTHFSVPVVAKRSIKFKEGRVLGGLGMGNNQNGLHLGVQAWFGLTGSMIKVVPEVVYNTGARSGLGGTLNAVVGLPYRQARAVEPYLGVGYGVRLVKDAVGGGRDAFSGVNLMLGGSFRYGNADLFLDVSTLRFFDYTRIALGYRFDF